MDAFLVIGQMTMVTDFTVKSHGEDIRHAFLPVYYTTLVVQRRTEKSVVSSMLGVTDDPLSTDYSGTAHNNSKLA